MHALSDFIGFVDSLEGDHTHRGFPNRIRAENGSTESSFGQPVLRHSLANLVEHRSMRLHEPWLQRRLWLQRWLRGWSVHGFGYT